MQHYTCPGCGKIVVVDGKRVLHAAPECGPFIRKITEILGTYRPDVKKRLTGVGSLDE